MPKFIQALYKGQSLSNPAFWKHIQSLLTLFISLLPIVSFIAPGWITVELLLKINTFIGAMIIYLTNATSEKVGL
jgi:hypothetical protein